MIMKEEQVKFSRKITPDSELENLKDEEYLIFRAKECQSVNQNEGKSWLITAQTIFPKDFGIQFEIYKISKEEKNVQEASNCLKFLFQNFQNESALWTELDAIIAILNEVSCKESSPLPFITKIFRALPKETQKEIIYAAVQRAKDDMSYVSLMLLLTSSFPENTADSGLSLVHALMKAEKSSNEVLNPFRKKLVCELLPRFLQAEGLEVKPKLLYSLLAKAMEFYIVYSVTPTNVALSKLELESPFADPWQDLFSIVRLIGWNLGWELAAEFDLVSNREVILQKVQNMVESGARLAGRKGDDGEDVREVFFTTTTLFLHSFYDYVQRLNPEFLQDNYSLSLSSLPMTLVSAFTTPEPDEVISAGNYGVSTKILLSPPRSKRLRPSTDEDDMSPILTVSRCSTQASTSSIAHTDLTGQAEGYSLAHSVASAGTPQTNVCSMSISSSLISAIKCWRLLQAYEALRNEFIDFTKEISEIQDWLSVFRIDVLMYEGRMTEVETQIRLALAENMAKPSSASNLALTQTLNLKLASVLFSLNRYSAASECALELVELLEPTNTPSGFTPNLIVPSSFNRRHLHVLAMSASQHLQFLVTMLILALRQLVVVEEARSDLCLGHLIVLLQLEWPRHCHIFEEVVGIIRSKVCFSYKPFSAYVTTADILEEFMFLSSSYGVSLDILPLPNSTKQQRISTRGADRDSKQDFKVAMKKQMQRSWENVELNIKAYLQRHGTYIPHVFM